MRADICPAPDTDTLNTPLPYPYAPSTNRFGFVVELTLESDRSKTG